MSAGAARLCGRCGRVRPISRRARPGNPDICSGCYRPPSAVCSTCGRERPCTGIKAGRPLCSRCTPRSTSICAHCGQARPATVRWPEGAVCDTCYTAALRRVGECATCAQTRRLVAPPGPAANICASCSGAGPAGHVCTSCGTEDKLYQRGLCPRCALARRTGELLGGVDHEVTPALAGVREAIITAPQPRTALNWLRKGASAPLLGALADGRVALTHQGLDTQPPGRAVDYLRALLVAHGALPERDEAMARLERRITATLASVPDVDDRRILTRYATWRVLHHLRYRAREHPLARTATRNATLSLDAATALLAWIKDRDIRLDRLPQSELEQWLLHGPARLTYQVADFLAWAATRHAAPRLLITRPATAAGPATGQAEHQHLVAMLLHEPDIAPIDRVVGCLSLMYGQQLSRVAVMTHAQIHDSDTVLRVRFGRGDIIVDEPLASHLRAHMATPRRHHSIGAPTHSDWLFPGHLPGRPITPAALGARMANLGINAQTGRRAAMHRLAAEVPAAVLADLLGIAITTAVEWVHTSGGDWANYAAQTARGLPHPAHHSPA